MQSALADTIGSVAGILTTVAFLPQVIKTWKRGSARDFSLVMLISFCTGVALWLAYGLMLGAWPVILCNGATLGLACPILLVKLKEKGRPEDRPENGV